MKKFDLIKDLNTLTTIPVTGLQKIADEACLVIADNTFEAHCVGETSSIDIGIGTLYIEKKDSSIAYHFIPCKKLEDYLKDVFNNKQSPLIDRANHVLSEKIIRAYKEFM